MLTMKSSFILMALTTLLSQSAFANFTNWDCKGKLATLSGTSGAGSQELSKGTLEFNGKHVDLRSIQLNLQSRLQEFDLDDLTVLVIPSGDQGPTVLVFELPPPDRFDQHPRWQTTSPADTLTCNLNM